MVESAQRQNVCLRKIDDMDIITHAGPVARRVIFAENGDLLALAECDLTGRVSERSYLISSSKAIATFPDLPLAMSA